MDEENPATSRRKACDLCFTKKIRCDMLKPTCSNCSLYHAQCRTTTIRRRAKPLKARSAPSLASPFEEGTEAEKSSDGSTSARLDRIEAQLQEVLHGRRGVQEDISESHSTSYVDEDHHCVSRVGGLGPRWSFNSTEPKLYYGPQDGSQTLPVLENIMPVIDHYFNTTNRFLPLFHQPTFMRRLTRWYTRATDRHTPSWAAILMVAALGLRSDIPLPNDAYPNHHLDYHQHNHDSPDQGLRSSAKDRIQWADYCLRNAQSALPELATRIDDLLGVQVLLALVMVFCCSSDLASAGVLMGSAVRLAHRLHLHSKDSEQYFNAQEIQERSRVFWLVYIFDKDISLRTKTPSMQLDADIDIPMPPPNPADGAGLIHTHDGRSSLNIFRLRINLAHIQGKVHDLLYSNRASKIPSPERQRRIDALQSMLDRWYGDIPPAFRVEHVAASVGGVDGAGLRSPDLVEMTVLYHTFLLCVVSIHGVYSYQAEWMQKAGSLSRAAMEDYARSMLGKGVSSCSIAEDGPGEAGWRRCVELSRGCMKLFHDTMLTERLLWNCFCPHFSGLLILLANMFISPTHDAIPTDQLLVAQSTQLLNDTQGALELTLAQVRVVQQLVDSLSRSASQAINQARLEREMMSAGYHGGQEKDLAAVYGSGGGQVGFGVLDGEEEEEEFGFGGLEFEDIIFDPFLAST